MLDVEQKTPDFVFLFEHIDNSHHIDDAHDWSKTAGHYFLATGLIHSHQQQVLAPKQLFYVQMKGVIL